MLVYRICSHILGRIDNHICNTLILYAKIRIKLLNKGHFTELKKYMFSVTKYIAIAVNLILKFRERYLGYHFTLSCSGFLTFISRHAIRSKWVTIGRIEFPPYLYELFRHKRWALFELRLLSFQCDSRLHKRCLARSAVGRLCEYAQQRKWQLYGGASDYWCPVVNYD